MRSPDVIIPVEPNSLILGSLGGGGASCGGSFVLSFDELLGGAVVFEGGLVVEFAGGAVEFAGGCVEFVLVSFDVTVEFSSVEFVDEPGGGPFNLPEPCASADGATTAASSTVAHTMSMTRAIVAAERFIVPP